MADTIRGVWILDRDEGSSPIVAQPQADLGRTEPRLQARVQQYLSRLIHRASVLPFGEIVFTVSVRGESLCRASYPKRFRTVLTSENSGPRTAWLR